MNGLPPHKHAVEPLPAMNEFMDGNMQPTGTMHHATLT